jgi:pimeloyl-ACP methyl ester carboxylesterase
MAWLGWIAGGYAALVGGAYAVQRSLMYPAPHSTVEPRLQGGTLLRIPGEGGRTVFAFHVPAPAGSRTIVHFHGNGEALADQVPLADTLRRRRLGVLAVEYPGYGLASRYSPSEENLYSDAQSALRHLERSLDVARESVVLQGQSLGTGVAMEMAHRGFGARLVLISPFTSMTDMVRRVAPILPASLVVRDRYDNLEKAPAFDEPVLVIVGERDNLVPSEMGKRLAAAFPNARLYVSPESGHADLYLKDGKRIFDAIVAFAEGVSR